MKKVRIKLGIIGYLPFDFNRKLVKNWKSDVFEIVDDIDDFHFTKDSDTSNWAFSDRLLSKELPIKYEGDFFMGITYVPIEANFYCRRLDHNRVVISFAEIYNILKTENIPIENFILRSLYASCLVYLRNEQTIPKSTEWLGYTHDDTRGCLFDMNGSNIDDIIFSLDHPIICDECTNRLRQEKVPDSTTELIKKEIKRIRKAKYYKIAHFVKRKPLLSILLSGIFGIFISLSASIIYGALFTENRTSHHPYEYFQCCHDSLRVQKPTLILNFSNRDSITK
jgi:hypothetical protein